MNFQTARILAKIKAVNAANAEAMRLYPILAQILRPFVNQKIVKIDGSFLEKIRKLLPEIPHTSFLSVYKIQSDYSIAFGIRAWASIENHPMASSYYETTVYIGKIEGQTLIGICEPPEARPDWELENVLDLCKQADNARAVVREIESKLGPFNDI